MPQLEAAKKALRQNARRRVINDRWRKILAASLRTIKLSLREKNYQQAAKHFIAAQSSIDRATRHRLIHSNKAARLKSKLARQVQSLNQ